MYIPVFLLFTYIILIKQCLFGIILKIILKFINLKSKTPYWILPSLALFGVLPMVPLVILPIVPLVANGTIGLPMVPTVPTVPLGEQMVPLALPLVQMVLPLVPLV